MLRGITTLACQTSAHHSGNDLPVDTIGHPFEDVGVVHCDFLIQTLGERLVSSFSGWHQLCFRDSYRPKIDRYHLSPLKEMAGVRCSAVVD